MTASGQKTKFLTCERNWVYFTLTAVAGFWGAYTYLLRGNVFCNAQTGNVVLMAMALGSGQVGGGAVLPDPPLRLYPGGLCVGADAPNPVKHHLPVRWDTLLIAIEILAIFLLGLLPESAPVQIAQVGINFIASMQYNTFRQAEGIPVATTFATNHIRQIGVGLAKELRHRRTGDKSHRPKLARHAEMLFFFASGAVVGTVFCHLLVGRAIWITALPMAVIFGTLLHADLTTERALVERKPSGH